MSDITLTSALSGGIVTHDSGHVVTARGVCWDTTAVFRIDSCLGFTIDSLGLGNFSSAVTGLHEGTIYHLAAYATNEKGTGYGEIITFSTVPVTLPEVVTAYITNITTTSAECGGNVTSNGNGTVTMRGVCWDTLSIPTFENNLGHTEDGSGIGEFTSNITNLYEEKKYYVVAYATNEKGTGYGEIKSFTTSPLTVPSVTTSTITNITTNSDISGGTVLNNGGGTVTGRGVCWNLTGDPSLQNCIDSTSNGSGLGSFISNISGLTSNTTYYVCAYAINEEGTGYGNQLVFTTLTIPTVITSSVSNISYNSATSGGNVTNDGGAPVTARGVCWSTSENPTISNSHTTNGSGTGSFVSSITGLNPNTTYYVRAYGTNSTGTGYGNQVSFITLSAQWQCGNEISYEGQSYNTVQIGIQCWFKENLNVGITIEGGNNQTNNSVIEKYCYDNNSVLCTTFGGMYQWDEMMEYTTIQGIKGICPSGWHIPTDLEWTSLTDYLGGEDVAGGKMKETGTSHWSPPNTGATNSSGFTARGGGNYTNGSFYGMFFNAQFWSSTEGITFGSWTRVLTWTSASIYREDYTKDHGYSVRCLKD